MKLRQFETLGSKEFAKTYAVGASRVQLRSRTRAAGLEFATQLGEHDSGCANTMRGVQARRPSIYDLEADLRKMTVPTLILVGDEDDHSSAARGYLHEEDHPRKRPGRHAQDWPHA